MRMQKIIAQILILLMLFSNAVWAIDSDFVSSNHFSSKSEPHTDTDDTDGLTPHHNDSEDSDHCCHGAAHLIGLMSIKVMRTVKIKDAAQLQRVATLVSYKHLPPTPPPTH